MYHSKPRTDNVEYCYLNKIYLCCTYEKNIVAEEQMSISEKNILHNFRWLCKYWIKTLLVSRKSS